MKAGAPPGRKSWGESAEAVELHHKRLLSFYTTYVPELATEEGVSSAWEAEGPGLWEKLENKHPGKTTGFNPKRGASRGGSRPASRATAGL